MAGQGGRAYGSSVSALWAICIRNTQKGKRNPWKRKLLKQACPMVAKTGREPFRNSHMPLNERDPFWEMRRRWFRYCVNIPEWLTQPEWPSLLGTWAAWESPPPPGYKTGQYKTRARQHDCKSRTRENDATKRHDKHEMHEAAAFATWRPVS